MRSALSFHRTRLGFCLLLAGLAVLVRVVLIDHAFFRLLHLPSHDMSQGLAFFATSMHSLRLSGDIAWWYPGSFTGYAQYFQALVGPLAPTFGHVVFIAWAHLIALLGLAGLALPEYQQYLAVNFVVLPFLAFAAFAWFCSLFLRHRAAIALALVAFVFSGIGAWNSAWFYFQESFSAFFLLAAAISALQRPVPARLLVLLAAVLIQFASLNYWTLYNAFFVPIVLGAYGFFHRNQVVRLGARLRALWSARPVGPALAAGLSLAVIAAWTAVIVASVVDQSAVNVRNVYTPEEAVARIGEWRRFTTELFNPSLERALAQYPVTNPMHSARYIGIALLPLIALGAMGVAERRSRWLLASALLVLFVCVGSPFLVAAWTAIPMMDRIRHLFYFYSQYWQVLLVLLAALGLDALLRDAVGRVRRAALWLTALGAATAVVVMAGTLVLAHTYPLGDINLQAILRGALFLGVASALLFRGLWLARRGELRLAAGAFVLLLFVDLTAYFYSASRADLAFTTRITEFPAQAEARGALARPWPPARTDRAFAGAFESSMPIRNMFWPANVFMFPVDLNTNVSDALFAHARAAEPVAFYEGAARVPWRAPIPNELREDPAAIDRELLLADPGVPARTGGPSRRIADGFSYRFNTLRYNDFELAVTVPRDGWLMVRQLHDHGWRVMIGTEAARPSKANYVAMAVPLRAGTHTLRWEYRPLARALYWPAAVLLEAVVALFLVVAWHSRHRTLR